SFPRIRCDAVQWVNRAVPEMLSRLRRLGGVGPVLLTERLVDVDQHLTLPTGECDVGPDRGQHVTVRLAVLDETGLDVERLGGDVQTLRDLVQDLRARLAQAPFNLAQVRVGHPGLRGELTKRDLRLLPLLA